MSPGLGARVSSPLGRQLTVPTRSLIIDAQPELEKVEGGSEQRGDQGGLPYGGGI